MKYVFAIVLLISFDTNGFAQNSENGYWCTNKGTLRVLLVYAEVVNDPAYNNFTTANWPSGEMPLHPDTYFSEHENDNDGLMTKYFHEASFGGFNLIGDYFPELIQVDYSKAGYQSVRQVVAAINDYKKKKLKSANGHLIQPGNFDSWTFTKVGMPKINVPDSLMDLLMIVWRVNSKLSSTSNSGYCSMGSMIIPLRGYKGLDCYSEFVSHENDAFTIMRHEFSHTLYGGNNFHTGGGGAGQRTFIPSVGGYSNLSSWDHCSDGWNAWDRWRMGWKNPVKQFLISGYVKNSNEFIEKNFEPYTYNTDSETVYIRDYKTTGDAVRIKFPFIDSPTVHQYLWLEFHADTSTFDIAHTEHLGMYAYVEAGKDDKQNMNGNYGNSPGNYLYFLPASGRFDFEYGKDSVRKKIFVKKTNSLANPFTGNHFLMRPIVDMNHNNKLDDNEMILPEMIISQSDDTVITYPDFGNNDDAFKPEGKTIINICSNPSSSNVTTYNYPYHRKSVNDEDTVYLNGLRVQIMNSPNIKVDSKKYQAMSLKVSWDDYTISNDVRWCGNIVLKPINKKVVLDVTNNSTLLLDRGLTVTQQNINTTDTLDGKLYFSNSTTFICYPNTVLHVHKGSTLQLSNKSTLIMRKGSELITDEGGEVKVDATSKIIKE